MGKSVTNGPGAWGTWLWVCWEALLLCRAAVVGPASAIQMQKVWCFLQQIIKEHVYPLLSKRTAGHLLLQVKLPVELEIWMWAALPGHAGGDGAVMEPHTPAGISMAWPHLGKGSSLVALAKEGKPHCSRRVESLKIRTTLLNFRSKMDRVKKKIESCCSHWEFNSCHL